MLRRALAVLIFGLSCGASWAGWGSIQYGPYDAEGIYSLADSPEALCQKFSDRVYVEADWGFSRMYFKYENPHGPSGGMPVCAMYSDAALTESWGDWFAIMDCSVLPNPFGSSWVCPSADQLGWGVESFGPWSTEDSSMSVGWITDLSPEQGGQIAGAILAIWALGWAFRTAIRALKTVDGETNHESES